MTYIILHWTLECHKSRSTQPILAKHIYNKLWKKIRFITKNKKFKFVTKVFPWCTSVLGGRFKPKNILLCQISLLAKSVVSCNYEPQWQNLLLFTTLNEKVNHLAKLSLENPVMIGFDDKKIQSVLSSEGYK